MPTIPATIILPLVDPTTITPPAPGTLGLVANFAGVLTTIQPNGTITAIAPINQTSDESVASTVAGNTNIGPGNGLHLTNVAVSGLGGTVRTFSLINVGLGPVNKGWRVKVFFGLAGCPAGITLQVFNGNTLGANLFNFTTDGTQASASVDAEWNGAAWVAINSKIPAINT